jgi:cyclopropane fatty-acyl-phospholipid synthase-like methyltransferase
MSSLIYRSAKAAFRVAIPHQVSSYFFDGRSPISRAILSIKARLEGSASHDDIYDRAYYANYTEEMEVSARGIVASIVRHFNPSSAIDIGCGSGEVLQRFKEVGIKAKGADLSSAALEYCRSKGLDVDRVDLENQNDVRQWRADVVLSLEVAEHIPASFADHFVRSLIAMANKAVVITGAPPGQGGTDHVNEQPYEYWIEKFNRLGARYSAERTAAFRSEWAASGVEASRSRNVMVFEKV